MTFIPNPDFERELQQEPEYADGLTDIADVVVDNARAIAPVLTGAYRDGLKVVRQGDDVYASATDRDSGYIEYGTVDTPIFAPLRRAARMSGLSLTELDK